MASAPEHARFGGFAAHLRVPLFRSAYALMATTAVTAILGVVYWALAARTYQPSDIGRASAAISMMIFLAGAAQLNLAYALPRLLPVAGASTRRYILRAYAVTVVVAIALAAGFVWLFGDRSFLAEHGRVAPLIGAWYVIAVAAWTIFSLQDGVLAGLRKAIWVPIENAAFAAAKVVLLVAFAAAMPRWGLLASWTVPMLLTLLPVTYLILRRFVPENSRSLPRAERPLGGRVRSYLVAEYAVGTLQLGAFSLVPVIVASSAGLTSSGYFYTAWIVGLALDLALMNITTALTVEGARDEAALARHARLALRLGAVLVVPTALATIVLAPYGLALLGGAYAEHGTPVLRLVAAGVVVRLVGALFIAIARVRRRMRQLVVMEAAHFALIIGLTLVLVPAYGIVGAGAAYCATHALLAVALLPFVLQEIRPEGSRRARRARRARAADVSPAVRDPGS
jgi:O-antigen/teichoic acid export membrane protein